MSKNIDTPLSDSSQLLTFLQRTLQQVRSFSVPVLRRKYAFLIIYCIFSLRLHQGA